MEHPELECNDLGKIVDLMEEGVDQIVYEISGDPNGFVEDTMPGWKCLPEPIEMSRDGRNYIVGITCFKQISDMRPGEMYSDDVGMHFAKQLDVIFECFSDQIIVEQPSRYGDGNSEVFGEGMVIALDRGPFQNVLVQIDYNYGRAVHGGRFYWGLEFSYARPVNQ
ncbi:hypothetical protein [Marinivivus vitaminiproducens]|uniref:hypothetical protein n=1 Tax=Marinivivus vitaminiproducens TaxID=3035935 RepID=UPI0027A3AA10|nr:hypothetical protein P4R82_09970 [Geminicoccaceae bacterium SCSIO 64248]